MSSSATQYDMVFEKDFGKDFAFDPQPAAAGQARRNAGAELVAKFRKRGLRASAEKEGQAPGLALPPSSPAPVLRVVPQLAPGLVPPVLPAPSVDAAPQAFAAKPAATLEADDLQRFVATNWPKFMPTYLAQVAGGRWRPAICWPAFFAPVVWAMYRKMYAVAAVLLLTPIALSMLHAPTGLIRASAASSWALAWYGRHLYVWGARRTLAEIRASASDDATALDAIGRAGGVSRAGAVIGVLLTLCVVSAIRQSAIPH